MSGQDLHRTTAAELFGVPAEEVTPEQRRYAKTANFVRDYATHQPHHPRGFAAVEGDEIVIRIPVTCLATAWEYHPDADFVDEWPVVTDAAVFAEEIVHRLNREDEDGSTPITMVLDGAMQLAVEDGCDGIAHD